MLPTEMPKQRPSYVRFERKAVEDRARSEKLGRYSTVDADFALVTPMGSKDVIVKKVDDWFAVLRQYVREERFPSDWLRQYEEAYEAWKKGEEVPLNGTPIKGWPVLSPAQQANVIGANVLTVEDLAQCNDEAQKRIGMGAIEIRDKAIAWLRAANSSGVLVQENLQLRAENKSLHTQIEQLNARLREKELV